MERCAGATRESLHEGKVSASLRHPTRAQRHELTVSGMGIDGLEKTEGDPDVDSDDVQVWLEPAVEQWPNNRPRS
jgi:hypothetical protein